MHSFYAAMATLYESIPKRITQRNVFAYYRHHGAFAHRFIKKQRENILIHDDFLGFVHDTRPIPSARILALTIALDHIEQRIRKIIERA